MKKIEEKTKSISIKQAKRLLNQIAKRAKEGKIQL